MRGAPTRSPVGAVVAASVLAVLALAGCSEQGLQPDQGTPWSEWTHPTTAPVEFSGKTADGATFSSQDHLGKVVVVNFWFAGCNPCRAEAPTLNTVAKDLPQAQFVGVNVSDNASTTAGFERSHGNTYPSIVDQEQGASVQLAFAANRPPKAVPSTLVLDRKGRVTARIIGQANESVLKTLVQDAINGHAR
jgi:thiol-disulfide isomerase/thioredoxin